MAYDYLAAHAAFLKTVRTHATITPELIHSFQELIHTYFTAHGRTFDWRYTADPYHVFVSEVMLQQTQTDRVISKYREFIALFPRIHDLQQASLRDVLAAWQGLGYNRRGKALYDAAGIIVERHGGTIPDRPEELINLPGIGPATAASITTFAYNKPTMFIETNVRAVFLHSFFQGQTGVPDKELVPLVQAACDQQDPRTWYYALMDYGVMLKKTFKNPSRKSLHHTVQSRFEGSDRQVRGEILRQLLDNAALTFDELRARIGCEAPRLERILTKLCADRMLERDEEQGYNIA